MASLFRKLPLIGRFFADEEVKTAPAVGQATNVSSIPSAETLGNVFPSVKSIAVNLAVTDPESDIHPTMHGKSFEANSRAYFLFRCKNADCRGGGFDLTEEIEKTVALAKPTTSGRRVCNGKQPSEYKVSDVRCCYELNFKINIQYKALDS